LSPQIFIWTYQLFIAREHSSMLLSRVVGTIESDTLEVEREFGEICHISSQWTNRFWGKWERFGTGI